MINMELNGVPKVIIKILPENWCVCVKERERARIAWKEKHRYRTSLPFEISMDYYNLRLNEINVPIPTRERERENRINRRPANAKGRLLKLYTQMCYMGCNSARARADSSVHL